MSEDLDVKQFADMMVNDHGKANAELKSLAEKQGLTVPASLDEEHAALLKTLEKAGDHFDPQYAKAQLDAHEAAVELFENYASKGENKALQNFAVADLADAAWASRNDQGYRRPHRSDQIAASSARCYRSAAAPQPGRLGCAPTIAQILGQGFRARADTSL